MNIKQNNKKKRKIILSFFGFFIMLNSFTVFYWLDSEIEKICQPSERYNMAESYRPGGGYKSYAEDSSVVYSGYVRLSGKSCTKIPDIDIEFWFSNSKGNYSKETRLKVKTNEEGFFEIKTGGFQEKNLPYHIHYLVSGPGIRPMTGNYNNTAHNSNDKFDIIVIPANDSNYRNFLNKELSSGDNFVKVGSDKSIISNLKTIDNLERTKIIGFVTLLILSILLISILLISKKKKTFITISLLSILIALFIYNNDTVNLYDSKTIYQPEKIKEKAVLKYYQNAKWAPILKEGSFYSITEQIEIPEQENMLSQVFVSDLNTKDLEEQLRGFYINQGIELGQSAVNMWGADANWQYSLNFSGITLGKEVNITISKKLGDGRALPDGLNSLVIIWQIESESINKYIVDRFTGFGDGFISPENLEGW